MLLFRAQPASLEGGPAGWFASYLGTAVDPKLAQE